MRHHYIMEAARKKLIAHYDDIEEKKKVERYAGAVVIRQQIAVFILIYVYKLTQSLCMIINILNRMDEHSMT